MKLIGSERYTQILWKRTTYILDTLQTESL